MIPARDPRERGLIFTNTVPSLLDGTKTQTRRLLNLDRAVGEPLAKAGEMLELVFPGSRQHYGYITPQHERPSWRVQRLCDVLCDHTDDVGPYDGRHPVAWGPLPHAPGDRIWVREGFTYITGNGIRVHYRSDGEPIGRDGTVLATEPGEPRWASSVRMPRNLSRITLEVTEVRVQRLQDISEEDARAEGVEPFFARFPEIGRDQRITSGELARDAEHRASFAVLWDEINGDRALWSANPWVWALTFKRIEEPWAQPT